MATRRENYNSFTYWIWSEILNQTFCVCVCECIYSRPISDVNLPFNLDWRLTQKKFDIYENQASSHHIYIYAQFFIHLIKRNLILGNLIHKIQAFFSRKIETNRYKAQFNIEWRSLGIRKYQLSSHVKKKKEFLKNEIFY